MALKRTRSSSRLRKSKKAKTASVSAPPAIETPRRSLRSAARQQASAAISDGSLDVSSAQPAVVPSTPVQTPSSILRLLTSQVNATASTPASTKSVRFDLGKNTFRSTFRCICCRGKFLESEVETLRCRHLVCGPCASDVVNVSSARTRAVLKKCLGCRLLARGDEEGADAAKKEDGEELACPDSVDSEMEEETPRLQS